MKRIRMVLVAAGVVLGLLALGGIGVAAVNIYQQLNTTPTDPPAARGIVPSAPPVEDDGTAERWGELFREHAAGARYTTEDAADIAEGWRAAVEEVTSLSSDEISGRVTIRTTLEPGDKKGAGQIATVFGLWQEGDPATETLAPSGAGWVDHGVVSVYAVDDTLLLANMGF